MYFCVNCGNKNESGTVFCIHCGQALNIAEEITLKVETQEQENIQVSAASLPKKKMSRGGKIVLSLLAIIFIIGGITYTILDKKFDPMNKVQTMHSAYTNGDNIAFYEQFTIPENTVANADTFMSMVQEYGWESLRTEFVEEIKKFESGIGQDAIQYTYGDFIVIKNKPILFGLFNKFEFSIVPLEVDVYSPLEGIELTIGDKTVTTDVTDGVSAVGNYLPGEYTYSYKYDKGYVPLEGEGTVYIFAYDEPRTTAEIDFDWGEVDLYSEMEDSVVYVNGKSSGKTVEELGTLAPVMYSEGVEIYAVAKDANGKEIKSDVYNLTDSNINFEFEYLRQQEAVEEIMQEIENIYQNYRYDYDSAIYYADFSYVTDYFESGSQTQKDYQKFVEDHVKIEDYSYNFIRNEVTSVAPISDAEYELLSTEEFNYSSSADGTLNYVRDKRYVFEYKDGAFLIKTIEDLNTKKTKID